MSKRTRTASAVENPRNFWPTPYAALVPLLEDMRPGRAFVEPCAGDYRLAGWLEDHGHLCVGAYDIKPQNGRVEQADALTRRPLAEIVTNPPFARHLLEPLMRHWLLTHKVPMTLLLPLDMVANLWCAPYAPHISRIVPVGRVSWLGNGQGGYENYVWFRFEPTIQPFVARRAARPGNR